MVHPEKVVDFANLDSDIEVRTMEKLRDWASEHVKGIQTLLDYDPDRYPHQRLDVVHIPAAATPENFAQAARMSEAAMGLDNYSRFVHSFRVSGGADRALTLASSGISTLIASGHLRGTEDTALSHHLLLAACGDLSFADHNVLLGNHIHKFIGIGDIPATDVLSWSGDVILAMPARSALSRGIDREVYRASARQSGEEIERAVTRGVALHRALTGTRAGKLRLANGQPATVLPRLDERSFKWTIENTPWAVPVPMDYKLGDVRGDVEAPVELKSEEDVVALMEFMAAELSKYSGDTVVYGKPEGSMEVLV